MPVRTILLVPVRLHQRPLRAGHQRANLHFAKVMKHARTKGWIFVLTNVLKIGCLDLGIERAALNGTLGGYLVEKIDYEGRCTNTKR